MTFEIKWSLGETSFSRCILSDGTELKSVDGKWFDLDGKEVRLFAKDGELPAPLRVSSPEEPTS